MTIKTFNWQMDVGASADTQYKVNRTQFGDGYAQLSSFGINNKKRTWAGTKTGQLDNIIKPIMAFIDDHAGVKPFLWTDPLGDTKQYTCSGYLTPQRKGDYWQIELNFEQFNGA